MIRVLGTVALGIACLALSGVRADEPSSKEVSDEHFVMKASAAGLAEVNLANVAVTRARNEDVKHFAEHMIRDHGKANQELIALADKKGWKVATAMNEHHQKVEQKLMTLRGDEFDRHYMHSQVEDHRHAVKLFAHEAKHGKDEQLKTWAEKTLPTLKDHLKMAEETHDKVKGSGKASTKTEKE